MRTFKEYLVENFENIYKEFSAGQDGLEESERARKHNANLQQNIASRKANKERAKSRDVGRKAFRGAKVAAGAGIRGGKKVNNALKGNRKYVVAAAVATGIIVAKRRAYLKNKVKLQASIKQAKEKGDYNKYYSSQIKLAKISGRYGGEVLKTPARMIAARKQVGNFRKLLAYSRAKKRLVTSVPK